jgi:Mg2+ and Co2+ transporter CorA
MFPFQWRIKGYDNETFSEQISLRNIHYGVGANWERLPVPHDETERDGLYNERNYFYEFVHDALYDNGNDNSLVRHFERNEPKHDDVSYIIDCGENVYELKVDAINLNLYSTGVGVLSFYLYNEKYPEPEHVLRINQAGRRVFPPFMASLTFRGIIANSIEIKGLHGRETGYREDFNRYTNEMSNQPAAFITDMIHEVAENINLKPVIDDRMFVQCWYKNDEWTGEFCGEKYDDFLNSSKWYEFVFMDNLNEMSCKNKDMQQEIIKKATYERWQNLYSLYGISRYSMVYLTNHNTQNSAPFLFSNFETMYARMAELILVEKASVLRFSAEVTNLSNMNAKTGFSEKVSSLYKEYIRFVNQIHFREISAQDQGIEMYQKLYDAMNLKEHVEKLDDEIEELYNYVSLNADRKTNNTMSLLTWIATIAVPMSVVAGIFGMNNAALLNPNLGVWYNHGSIQLTLLIGLTIFVFIGILIVKNRRLK